MAEPKKLFEGEGVESVWDDGCYSEARLLIDDDGKEFVGAITSLINEAEAVRAGQLAAWRAETIAQANVDYQNYKLDQLTTRLDQLLTRTLEDQGVTDVTAHPRYKTYFTDPLSKVKDMALERQVAYSSQWPTFLAQEPEVPLQELAPLFEKLFVNARAALAQRDKAAAETRVHRVQKIQKLVEEGNNTRLATYNKLSLKMLDQKLAKDWPESFFRKGQRSTTTPEDTKRSALLQMFAAREISLSDENRKKINSTKDIATLNRWLSKISNITKQEDLFEG
jgi:hypothetical protein